jgi:hypothetical protein
MEASIFRHRQLWAWSTYSPLKETDLQMVLDLNGGNLRDTGHSSKAAPMTALAELQTDSLQLYTSAM